MFLADYVLEFAVSDGIPYFIWYVNPSGFNMK